MGIFIGKPLDDVTKNQTQLVASLHSILGGKQEHVVCCDSVKSINSTTTEVSEVQILTQESVLF